jgi:hypothetical protein
MDFIQTYDDYPVMSMVQFDGLGLCREGEAPAFVRGNSFATDGTCPLNTSGGQLSCGQAGAAGGFLGLVEAIPVGVQALGQLAATTIALTSGADPKKVQAVLDKTTERQLDIVSDWAGGEFLKKGLGLVPVPSDIAPKEAKEIQEVISKFGEGWRESRHLIRERAEQWLEGHIETDEQGNAQLEPGEDSSDLEIGGSIPPNLLDNSEASRAALDENAEDAGDDSAADAEAPVFDDGSFLLESASRALGDLLPFSPVLNITGPAGSFASQMLDLTLGTRNIGVVSAPKPSPSSGGGNNSGPCTGNDPRPC